MASKIAQSNLPDPSYVDFPSGIITADVRKQNNGCATVAQPLDHVLVVIYAGLYYRVQYVTALYDY